ncbi:MAG: hypothetical protein GY801_47120 [bacterium]|nr:hypothetical protein [bacterium]
MYLIRLLCFVLFFLSVVQDLFDRLVPTLQRGNALSDAPASSAREHPGKTGRWSV